MSNKTSRIILIIQLISLGLSTNAMAQDSPKPVLTIVRPASPPALDLPLNCTYGVDCWAMNYTDLSAENDGKTIDNGCAARTYDGHTGTDFAVRDQAMMSAGVDVLAVASGTIVRVRDSEEDKLRTIKERDDIKAAKKECGNGILMKLENGDQKPWHILYCHLKKGSIAVKQGDKVERGQKLAQVGLSGLTDYPHLHMGLTHGDAPIDPFTGRPLSEGCDGAAQTPLWSEKAALTYVPVFVGPGGFSDAVPTLATLQKKNQPVEALDHRGAAIIFYTTLWGTRAGDVIDLVIEDPQGKIFAKDHIVQSAHRARQLYFIGRKQAQEGPFEKGNYKATLSLNRADKTPEKEIFLKKEYVLKVQ